MVKLDTANAVTVGDEDVEYTVPELPGFKLSVKAGSVTFPDGSKSGQLSVTAVNANKVPMPPPNGMQPQFIVTIQPAGAMFDPPAPLSIPNTDGKAPGAQVEMYSYDHDLEEFVTIGLGTVSKDGSVINSNTGVGVIKAGWHCGSQPNETGCGGACGELCTSGCECEFDPAKPLPGDMQTDGDCQNILCGGPEEDTGDAPEDDPNDCVDPSCGDPIHDNSETPNIADTPNDCKKPACVNGSPGFKDDPSDEPKCSKCVGQSAVPDDSLDCNDDNVCTFNERCEGGGCKSDPVPDGQITECMACQGGAKTTIAGACETGTQCSVGTCNQYGGCDREPANDGMAVGACKICQGGNEVADPSKNNTSCKGGDPCWQCLNGGCYYINDIPGCTQVVDGSKSSTEDPPPPPETDPGSPATVVVTDRSATVNDNDILFISPEPWMPEIAAQLQGAGIGQTRWKFQSTYDRRTPIDDKVTYREASTTSKWHAHLDYQGQFFGGDVTITSDKANSIRKFKILGENPQDNIVVDYLRSRMGMHWYALPIAKHESRIGSRIYNQFNEGTVSYTDEPNKGDPDGWGVMQLDGNGLNRIITSEEVWNWKINVNNGVDVVSTKRNSFSVSIAQYSNYAKNKWPAEWEEPPTTMVISGTNTVLSLEEVCTIQLYNFAKVIWTIPGHINKYLSCVDFDPTEPSGSRWFFVKNPNDYVYKVIKEYETP